MTHLLLRTAHRKRHDEVFPNRLRGDGASAATVPARRRCQRGDGASAATAANLGANLLVTVTSAVPSESGPQPPPDLSENVLSFAAIQVLGAVRC
jgi:hypothetical protein